MSRLRYVLLGLLAAAAIAVVVVVAAGRGGHASTARSLARGQLLGASATISPQSLLFGEPIHVRIDAVVDRRQVDPNRVRLDAKWTPYQPVTPGVRTVRNVGPYARLHWAIDLHCVVVDCVPQAGSIARQAFETATIDYPGKARNGRTVDAIRITWPQVSAVSRLDPLDIERRAVVQRIGPGGQLRAALPPWRVSSTNLAAVTYRLAPDTVFWLATAFALVLVVAAGVILAPYLPVVNVHRRRPPSRLERALEAVERARGGATVDERKALELLAAELRRSGSGGLAWTATELAWSPSEPAAERTAELTHRVRSELAERTNGHRA
ncbi:MAG: hypothetical protein ACJ747_07620 [Gaiellaceae bacterium]|jgi:hypothetical protein